MRPRRRIKYRTRTTAATPRHTICIVDIEAPPRANSTSASPIRRRHADGTLLLTHHLAEQDPHELNDRRSERHDKEGRKQQEHQRKHELDANLRGGFFCALPTLGS